MNTFHILFSHMALKQAELTGTKCEQWRESVGFYVSLVLIFTAIIRAGRAQDLVHIDDQVFFVGPKFKLRSVTVTSYCHDWQEDIKAIFDRSYDLRLVMSI